jgi:hypothetical protein
MAAARPRMWFETAGPRSLAGHGEKCGRGRGDAPGPRPCPPALVTPPPGAPAAPAPPGGCWPPPPAPAAPGPPWPGREGHVGGGWGGGSGWKCVGGVGVKPAGGDWEARRSGLEAGSGLRPQESTPHGGSFEAHAPERRAALEGRPAAGRAGAGPRAFVRIDAGALPPAFAPAAAARRRSSSSASSSGGGASSQASTAATRKRCSADRLGLRREARGAGAAGRQWCIARPHASGATGTRLPGSSPRIPPNSRVPCRPNSGRPSGRAAQLERPAAGRRPAARPRAWRRSRWAGCGRRRTKRLSTARSCPAGRPCPRRLAAPQSLCRTTGGQGEVGGGGRGQGFGGGGGRGRGGRSRGVKG